MKSLLRVDCIAGAVAGALLLMLGGWLGSLYALPRGLLLFTGAANLLYACCSSLARRPRRPRALIGLLHREPCSVPPGPPFVRPVRGPSRGHRFLLDGPRRRDYP